jgi:hypothetical protein
MFKTYGKGKLAANRSASAAGIATVADDGRTFDDIAEERLRVGSVVG